MTTAILALLAYALGSIPFAVLVSRALGLADPRSYGSRNPGATNVLRSGSKLAALLTLFGDAAKGWLAVWLAMRFGPEFGATSLHIAVAAVCVFLGHVFSVFLKFSGGKGVATAAGVLFGLSPMLGTVVLLVFIAIAAAFRYVSLASVAAAAAAPFVALVVFGANDYFAATTAMATVLILRHIENIKRLMAGEERRIGQGHSPSESN